MTAPAWGRVARGVVWHVLNPDALQQWPAVTGAWCGTPDTFIELTELRPPHGARPCRRCLAEVADYAAIAAYVTKPASTDGAAHSTPEIRDGIDSLLDAGVTPQDVVNGGLAGALDLATLPGGDA